jgi:hypothetical protein
LSEASDFQEANLSYDAIRRSFVRSVVADHYCHLPTARYVVVLCTQDYTGAVFTLAGIHDTCVSLSSIMCCSALQKEEQVR